MKSIIISTVFYLIAFASAYNPVSNKVDPKNVGCDNKGPQPLQPSQNGKTCTLRALGNQTDDTPQILKAFQECNNGGNVVFPQGQNYWIASRLNPVIYDVTIDWHGVWTACIHFNFSIRNKDRANEYQFSDNLTYWRNNSYSIFFQNHAAGFVITGDRIRINGHGTGGINGNGNAWYNAEQATTQQGRPMPFVFNNTSEVTVENCNAAPPLPN
jgi:galacturan 1,4-alpha-galacturonidase